MPETKEKEISEELQAALKSIVDEFDMDEKPVRERQIRLWKKLEYYFAGFTRIWWDDVAHDWRIFDDGYGYETNGMGYYDKPINVYRAYLESIIAALSSTVPAIKCIPDDADNELDVLTARGGTKIGELVYKHVDAPLLWVKALFTYCTQGMIAAYTYTNSNEEYGTVKVPKYEDDKVDVETSICPTCGMNLTAAGVDIISQAKDIKAQEENEFDPDEDDVKLHSLYEDGKLVCPQCAVAIDPEIKKEQIIVPRLVGMIDEPKARQCIEVYGGLFVKVPNWARSQKECPYLGYSYETHYTNVYAKWPHLRENADTKTGQISEAGGNEAYERWGRLSPQYYGEYPKYTPTVRHYWLRPSAFEACPDETLRSALKKKFPDGCKVAWVNDNFAEACNESLDDHWTITFNPLSEYIHFDPLGLLLTSVQEITQDLISLTLQTIEHGIPQVFADPSVLNFDQYRNTEVMPGGVYPAKPKSGKSLADGFYMVSTATLSQEVQPFSQQVQSLGQFVSGALPSLWGGEQAGSSRTAAQYSMSRNQSLQRLQTTWKMINYWWKNVFGKVIPAYIKNMKDDERLVTSQYNTFINNFIRRAELEGNIGCIEIESSDQLPSTWGQVKDTIMEMLQVNNPEILAAIGSPENLGILQEAIGLDDFKIPGEDDREKQYEEITLLLKSAPIVGGVDPNTQQSQEQPSVMPEFEVDNHQVEGEICRNWLVSEPGRLAKSQNPDGYKNVLLHLKMHITMLQELSNPGQVTQGLDKQGGNPQSQGAQVQPPNNQPPNNNDQQQKLHPVM